MFDCGEASGALAVCHLKKVKLGANSHLVDPVATQTNTNAMDKDCEFKGCLAILHLEAYQVPRVHIGRTPSHLSTRGVQHGGGSPALGTEVQLVHLFSDSTTVVAIFQSAKGKDTFIQACAREL